MNVGRRKGEIGREIQFNRKLKAGAADVMGRWRTLKERKLRVRADGTMVIDCESMPASAAGARFRVRTNAICAAMLFVCVWGFSLSRSVFDPIGYDQGLYQYMAERVIAGDRLYVDVWDQNGPGIVLVHWLSTRLVGNTPVAFRLFDAGWQALTLAALIALVIRSGRRWSAAWIAATLYALAYYSLGYVQTGQREGFTVLPLLLMVHLAYSASRASCRTPRAFLDGLIAGALGLFVFAIKPPMGLAYGALWLHAAGRFVLAKREQRSLPLAWGAGLTAGFIAAAAAGCAWLAHAGSWDAFWGVLSRRDMPGYILGPALLRALLPQLLAGAIVLGCVAAVILTRSTGRDDHRDAIRVACAAFVLFALVLSADQWFNWQKALLNFVGLWLPALGAVLMCAWRGRDATWRLCLLMLAACTAAYVLQGQFFSYHLPPLLAFAAFITAVELDDRWQHYRQAAHNERVWTSVCLGAVAYLVVGQWSPTMAQVTAQPYVLAGTTLSAHYDAITRHKLSCPKYSTTVAACERIRALTGENDPIACLFHEARIYYFARRPSVYKLIAIQEPYRHLFADFMQAIRERRPKVVVARIPESLRGSSDLHAIESAVFEETEHFWGPCGRTIRELYRATETVDDLCLLQPIH